jgi:UDP-2-acetamido-2,6-beta-L-arabino-hexul-4-ose reductase
MKVVVTGAEGFLGHHLLTRLRAHGEHEIVGVSRAAFADDGRLRSALEKAESVVHLAGINRDAPEVVEVGNIAMAQRLVAAIERVGTAPRIIYANSIQAEDDSPYGRGKRGAAETLEACATRTGGVYVDVVLPNVFGEGGRPHYNSFVATFCHLLATGGNPVIEVDRSVELVHAQQVAAVLIGHLDSATSERVDVVGHPASVSNVLEVLRQMSGDYSVGRFPELADPFDVELFNTYRSYLFPWWYPRSLEVKEDARGRFVELIHSFGGQGQTSYSTTRPGVTRGNHFHLRKIERFVVIEGEARIELRPVWGSEVTAFDVSGEQPTFVDMPTLHTHNITNTGPSELVTVFWINEIFDPLDADTFAERVS